MSTMEDKELQELFAAKRTVEANRRRQEELRKLMAASATPKSRRLWPVWALSAAACLALLLIALPMLFRSETAEPVLVAEATEIPTPKEAPDTNIATATSKTKTSRISRTSRKAATTPNTPLLVAEAEEPQPEPVPFVEQQPVEQEEPEEIIDNSPRIHRRTSTQMVCSNCNINNVPSPRYDFQQFLADAFGTGSCAPITLKSIEF